MGEMPGCYGNSQVLDRFEFKKLYCLARPMQLKVSALVRTLKDTKARKQEVEDQKIKDQEVRNQTVKVIKSKTNQEILNRLDKDLS